MTTPTTPLDPDSFGEMLQGAMLEGLLLGFGMLLHAAFVTSPVGWLFLAMLTLSALVDRRRRRRRRA